MKISSVCNNKKYHFGKNACILVLASFLSACSLYSSDSSENSKTDSDAIVEGEKSSANLRLHDIWALETIKGETVDFDSIERPSLELNLTEMKVMGTDGCNNFFGGIERLDGKDISFGPIAGTRKYCTPMTVPDLFNKQINNVSTYEIEGLKLRFFDAAGDELLGLKKVD